MCGYSPPTASDSLEATSSRRFGTVVLGAPIPKLSSFAKSSFAKGCMSPAVAGEIAGAAIGSLASAEPARSPAAPSRAFRAAAPFKGAPGGPLRICDDQIHDHRTVTVSWSLQTSSGSCGAEAQVAVAVGGRIRVAIAARRSDQPHGGAPLISSPCSGIPSTCGGGMSARRSGISRPGSSETGGTRTSDASGPRWHPAAATATVHLRSQRWTGPSGGGGGTVSDGDGDGDGDGFSPSSVGGGPMNFPTRDQKFFVHSALAKSPM